LREAADNMNKGNEAINNNNENNNQNVEESLNNNKNDNVIEGSNT
jgi:hypothetical protein